MARRRKNFNQMVYAHRRQDTLALLTDIAATQGRVEGLLGWAAYDTIAALADDGEYMDVHQSLAFWERIETLASLIANGGDPLTAIVYALEADKMGAEEAIARLRGLMLLQLAGWAMSEEI